MPNPTPRTRRTSSRPPVVRARRGARRAGFTLLEVIVAVTIVAILAAILVPNVIQFIGSSKARVAQSGVNTLANQVRLWMADNEYSTLPPDFSLDLLLDGDKPYLNNANALNDPWGNPFQIVIPGEVNRDFDIVSFGADGQPDGTGESADVISGDDRRARAKAPA